jgi:predicted DNA-binding ribbon-helix-helix protein
VRPVKRSFKIAGHRTSIALEPPFWEALKEVATHEQVPLAHLVARIDAGRGDSGLSSAVRVWLLAYYRTNGRRRDSASTGSAGSAR